MRERDEPGQDGWRTGEGSRRTAGGQQRVQVPATLGRLDFGRVPWADSHQPVCSCNPTLDQTCGSPAWQHLRISSSPSLCPLQASCRFRNACQCRCLPAGRCVL